jgi:hypothetical protein
MEIVMLVSWAIWTTRNDFIIKAIGQSIKVQAMEELSSGLSSFYSF